MGDYANVNNTDGAQGTYGVEEEYIQSVFFFFGKTGETEATWKT